MMYWDGKYWFMLLGSQDWEVISEGTKEEVILTCDHLISLNLFSVCDICGQQDTKGWVCVDKCCKVNKDDLKLLLWKLFDNPLQPCLQQTKFICNNHFGSNQKSASKDIHRMQMFSKYKGVWVPTLNFIEYPHENEWQIHAYKKL